jgi:PKD repeat protein
MKKVFLVNAMLIFSISFNTFGQSIPIGQSTETISMPDGLDWTIEYYKPLNYDSLTSPILFGIHGQGGSGADTRADLIDIANRRKALIIAPTFQSSLWVYAKSGDVWLPNIFKEIYHHVLSRENRDTIWMHMIGFSAGGQCVSRYMLVRQAIPDSIPIKMAVSSNPYFYTFCTDSLNGELMSWPCGINPNPDLDFTCNEHVKKYYNENYAVLIGTADTESNGPWACQQAQGANRYERAVNFYAFSDNDAIERGTTLKWQYGEVPGVGHNQYLMYNTVLAGDSIPFAEHLLFGSPYYPPVDFSPSADFYYELVDSISCTSIGFKALCTCQNEPINIFWNFGDGNTSEIYNPTHTYENTGIYQVELYVENSLGNANSIKNIYVGNDLHITVNNNINISQNPVCPGNIVYFSCYNSNVDSYLWNFGDGITSNTGFGVSHTYLSTGTYFISLTLSQNCYIDTTIYDTVYVENGLPLTGQFHLQEYDPPICNGGIVYFYGSCSNSLSTYFWDFGDSMYSNEEDTYHTYDSIGTYPVSLTINSCGSDTILHDSVVVQDNIEPELWWEYWPSEDEVCVNDTIEFWGWDTGGSYLWDFGDGDTTSIVIEHFFASWGWFYDIAKHTYSAPGDYTVSFTYTTNCGTFVDSFNVSILEEPIANFSVDTTVVYLPDATVNFTNLSINATSYLWDFGDTTTSTDTNPTHTYLYADTFTVSLIAVNGVNECTNEITKENYIIVDLANYINNLDNELNNLQIFPNPTTGQITISTGNEAIESIEIYDCLGRKKDEIVVNHRESLYIYNTKNMRGLYLFKIKTSENVYTERVWCRQ